MLLLDNPMGPIHGVMVWADHARSDLYYYLQQRPRLARDEDGTPEFVFLKFRRDITDNPSFDPDQKQSLGGGFLAFTTDLGIDDDVKDAVKEEVGRLATGEVNLTPVQFRKGTVRLSITKDATTVPGAAPAGTQPGFTFIEQAYGASTPSLYGDNRATFALALDMEGATLMQQALQSGICPIGVIYDLEYLGLRPAFDVKVTADYKRIYDSLEVQFGLSASYMSIGIKAQIDLAWQKLREDGSIKVEVVTFTDDENLRKQADAAFDFFKSELLQTFFQAALTPPASMSAVPNAGSAPATASQFAGVRPGLAGTQNGQVRPQFGTASPLAPTPAPPPRSIGAGVPATSQTATAVAGPGVSQLARSIVPQAGAGSVTPTAPGGTPAPAPSGTPAPAGTHPPNPMPPTPASHGAAPPPAPRPTVQLPGANAAQASKAAGSAFGAQLTFSLRQVHQDELKTREFEYAEQAAVAREAAPQGLFSTMVKGIDLSRQVKEISLDDDFFKRIVASVNMGSDLAAEGVDQVAVNLEYPASRPAGQEPTANDGALFKPGAEPPHTFTTWLNAAKSLDYQYQMTVHFAATSEWVGKGATVVSPWIVSRARTLTLDPLDIVGLFDLPISIGTVDPSILKVQVELQYKDDANGFTAHRTFELKPGDPVAHWKLRLSDSAQRTYSYRVTYVFAGNVPHTTDWVTTDDEALIVNDPFQGRIDLRLVPVLDVGNLQEADVEVVYSEPDTGYERRLQTTFAPPNLASQQLTIPTLAKSPAGTTVTTTVVRLDGSVAQPPDRTVTPDETAIVVTDGAGATRRITVKLADPNLADAQLLALKVTLYGPGDPPDTAEAIFSVSAAGDQHVTLAQPDTSKPWSYSYQVTGYTTRGVPRPGDTGTSSEATLLVSLPD
jgi:hypothetical protein